MDSFLLEKILSYIDAHIYEKISLNELAELAGYSPFYFSRLFSESMNMPVTAYIRIRKLQYAVVSLLQGDKILDISLMYAFDSHEGFTRAFTQLFGSTPSTVRKFLTSYQVPDFVIPNTKKRRNSMKTKDYETLQYNMHQLIFEILSESLKEAENGYCTEIEIILLPEGRIKITDNGRGIPLSHDIHADKEVMNKILSGSPITNMEYSQMGDFSQINMQTVNSLCEHLQVTVYRNGTYFHQDYIRGIAQHELIVTDSRHATGMEITLKPDPAIFGNTAFSDELIYKWLKEHSIGINKLIIFIKATV